MTSNLPRSDLTNTLESNRFGLASWGGLHVSSIGADHALQEAEKTKKGLVGMGRVCGAGPFGDRRRRAATRKEESGGEKERATAGMAWG